MKVKNSTRKKRGKITKIFVVLWAFVFLIIGFELFSKNEIRFVAKDYFLRVSSREIGSIEKAKHLDIKKVSLEEFLCNNNVTVDESLLLVNGKYKINENYVPQVIYHEECQEQHGIQVVQIHGIHNYNLKIERLILLPEIESNSAI